MTTSKFDDFRIGIDNAAQKNADELASGMRWLKEEAHPAHAAQIAKVLAPLFPFDLGQPVFVELSNDTFAAERFKRRKYGRKFQENDWCGHFDLGREIQLGIIVKYEGWDAFGMSDQLLIKYSVYLSAFWRNDMIGSEELVRQFFFKIEPHDSPAKNSKMFFDEQSGEYGGRMKLVPVHDGYAFEIESEKVALFCKYLAANSEAVIHAAMEEADKRFERVCSLALGLVEFNDFVKAALAAEPLDSHVSVETDNALLEELKEKTIGRIQEAATVIRGIQKGYRTEESIGDWGETERKLDQMFDDALADLEETRSQNRAEALLQAKALRISEKLVKRAKRIFQDFYGSGHYSLYKIQNEHGHSRIATSDVPADSGYFFCLPEQGGYGYGDMELVKIEDVSTVVRIEFDAKNDGGLGKFHRHAAKRNLTLAAKVQDGVWVKHQARYSFFYWELDMVAIPNGDSPDDEGIRWLHSSDLISDIAIEDNLDEMYY